MDFEEELNKYEERERTELDKARLKAQKAVSPNYAVYCRMSIN